LLAVFAAIHDSGLRPDLPQNLVLGVRRFDRQGLWRLSLIASNLIPASVTWFLSRELYRQGRGLVYNNRLRYWFITLALVALGDLMCLTFDHPDYVFYMGGLIRLGGATLATAVLIIPYLPPTHFLFRRTLSISIVGFVTFSLLLSSILTALALLPGDEVQAVLVGATAVAAVVTVIYLPLNQAMRTAVDGLLLGQQVARRDVLEEYEKQISQQLNLEELAEAVLDLLVRALQLPPELPGSALMTAQISKQGIKLLPITPAGHTPLAELNFSLTSPLAAYWQEVGEPLTQFDIEVLPDFAAVPEDELAGLVQWESQLYVPLYSSEKLVGLLAIGPKRSDAPYNATEARFLRSIIGRTVIALEQAQLLSDLNIANVQLTSLSDELAQVNRRLFEANRLKSGFIGVITHELRSPFVAIAFSLQIIERHGMERLAVEQRQQLVELKKGIIELKQMVDHLIAFASLLSKQGDLRMEIIDLGQVVSDLVQAMQPMAKTRQVRLDARIWPGLPTVEGDKERLSEAIYHLIHNAIKFNQHDGWVRVRCQPESDTIELRVQDSGIGIPPDKLDNLWNEFTQMADPLRRGVEGLGLGLALVRYVVIAHGGEVWAESEAGKGSTFGFKLPIKYAPSKPRP
jgi:signal transduction histidine kinase